MKISGCVITKNEEEYLRQSIASYIDYVDELIVVDDNSTDSTLDIARSFGDKVKIIQGTYNGNKAKQRQEYIDAATGDWLLIVDGDEVWFKKDLEAVKQIIGEDRYIFIPVRLLNFWKDFRHTIHGHMWNIGQQRLIKNIKGMGYHDLHHSVSIKPGVLLSDYAKDKGLVYPDRKQFNIPHYSYCKKANSLFEKIKYYMLRDNPNANTEEEAIEYALKHPFFSEEYHHPRYGDGGLYCCGNHLNRVDKIKKYNGSHPEIMKTHPNWFLYTEYTDDMNNYMETHWQYHNHLDHERHQNRIKYTGSFCKGNTLEIGCANGFSTNLLQTTYPDVCFSGVEPTDWGFNQAKKNYPMIKFYKGYAENLPFKNETFDTVLMPEIIEHCNTPQLVVEEAYRVAKRRLIITHPVNKQGQLADPNHKRFLDRTTMRFMCKKLCLGIPSFYGLDRTGQITDEEQRVYFGITVIDKE